MSNKREYSEVSGGDGDGDRGGDRFFIQNKLANTRLDLANLLKCVGCEMGYPGQRDHACCEPDRDAQIQEFKSSIAMYEQELEFCDPAEKPAEKPAGDPAEKPAEIVAAIVGELVAAIAADDATNVPL